MKLISGLFKLLGIIALVVLVLPAVVSFLIPVLSVVLIVGGVVVCIVFSLKFILGR